MIQLVGPGGAGKTTTGIALARRLALPFIDLDERFTSIFGSISDFINNQGYDAYAANNVSLYSDVAGGAGGDSVLALSSGFMTYRQDIHPDYISHRERIASSPRTFVLLPSLELDICVKETVRRQLCRPFRRSPEREEQVIRARFPVYRGINAVKVDTAKPVADVVDAIVAMLSVPC